MIRNCLLRQIAVAATCLLSAPTASRAEQFVLFDVTFTYTKEDADNSKPSKSHYYVRDKQLNADRPKDWTAPVDYRNGTVHIRTEVIDKPAGGEPTTWSLCYIPNKGQKNGYGCTGTVVYRETGVYEQDVSMKSFWQNDSIVWSEGIKQMDLVIKDGSGGNGHAHKRTDHEKFFPTKVRITMVQVSAGSKYDPSLVSNLPEKKEAAEPITLETVPAPAEITADEPHTKLFSPALAARSLDTAALDWQKTHACTACHTMLPYLMARPALAAISPQSIEVRQFFEDIVVGKREAMPSYSCKDVDGAVAIGIAAALAFNDKMTTGELHPLTRQALDQMWKLQRPNGDWEWPFRDSPPLKLNEHYGVTLAAIAVGMAPGDYARTPVAKAGMQGIRRYLAKNKPAALHQKAMTLWAAAYDDQLLSREDQDDILSKLLAVQRPDGGWSLANLVDNVDDPAVKDSDRTAQMKLEPGYGTEFLAYIGRDGAYKSSLASDGYATGFVIYIARQAGLPATDARLQRGIAWLKSNQRESGRWFTPSQAWHKQHLLSNIGTAFDVLALHACGEVPAVGIKK